MFKAILVVHTIYLCFFTSLLLHCFDRSIPYFRVLPVLSLAARIIPLLLAHIHFSFSVIRKKFGTFFLGSKDGRPDDLRHINIKNRVTAETKTRIEVLKLLASRYRASNPEGRAQVISFDPRPLIKLTPPPDASDRRIKTYNYVEAVRKLPCNFSSAEVAPILRRINPELVGQV